MRSYLNPRAEIAAALAHFSVSPFPRLARAVGALAALLNELEQQALAHNGVIGERLRKQSSVYYWQTTEQHKSRHEAVCNKQTKWHLITFGSHGRFSFKANQRCSMNAHGLPYVDSCVNNSLASPVVAMHAA